MSVCFSEVAANVVDHLRNARGWFERAWFGGVLGFARAHKARFVNVGVFRIVE